MRKIPPSQENPLDVVNINLMDSTCPFFQNLGFTPNGITTLSLIMGIIALVFLWHYNWLGFAISYYISYLFDCLDGHYARKYNMVSKFGDIYDHVKDVLVVVGIFVVIILRYNVSKPVWINIIIVTAIMSILMTAQLGCQERIYPKTDSATLNFSQQLCIGDPSQTIKITRWFGCGTWVVYIIIAVLFISYNHQKNVEK
jgi:phosphatidylglycerophosphate synthase